MGFVRIFWKNNVQEAYLPKMSISGQIVSRMLAGYTQKTPYKPSYFLGDDPKKFRSRFIWSFLCITGLRSQRQFAPKCSFLASRPLGHIVHVLEYPVFMTPYFSTPFTVRREKITRLRAYGKMRFFTRKVCALF